ncbi:hypothetical protein DB31_1080 [Hyalangium minutum]|uniref:Uncharacterized protein n=1 Tax=Hyalangium minutum TaxID=394096 RepID=A0A085WEA2_9BACT|nr:hypothetical protein DB31_1080 [Hyalangium minutum]
MAHLVFLPTATGARVIAAGLGGAHSRRTVAPWGESVAGGVRDRREGNEAGPGLEERSLCWRTVRSRPETVRESTVGWELSGVKSVSCEDSREFCRDAQQGPPPVEARRREGPGVTAAERLLQEGHHHDPNPIIIPCRHAVRCSGWLHQIAGHRAGGPRCGVRSGREAAGACGDDLHKRSRGRPCRGDERDT